jgi:hypothetical protein
MKTRNFSFAAIAAIVLGIGTTSIAANRIGATADKDKEVSTVLTASSKISRIEVRGNVEVYISDDEKDQITVYNHYYSQNALVQDENGVLRISSYSPEKLVVWVKASELASISAYDNAQVESFGKISSIQMDVALYDNAYAKLDIEGYSVKFNIDDHAKADLAGNFTDCSLDYYRSATVNSTKLTAAHLTRKIEKAPGEQLVEL